VLGPGTENCVSWRVICIGGVVEKHEKAKQI